MKTYLHWTLAIAVIENYIELAKAGHWFLQKINCYSEGIISFTKTYSFEWKRLIYDVLLLYEKLFCYSLIFNKSYSLVNEYSI